MPKIKICGLTRTADIFFVNEAKCDYVGFVFAEGSRRKVTVSQAKLLKDSLSREILSVGVFSDNKLDFIENICQKGIIDIIQLHGNESEEFVSKVKTVTGKPIIKAISAHSFDKVAQGEQSSADYVLFDTYSPNMKGGTGKVFDWDLLKGVTRPFFLAGGINLSNIALAYQRLKPFCFDVSSGAETDGVKDKDKINSMVKLVRSLK